MPSKNIPPDQEISVTTASRHGHAAELAYQWIKDRILNNHWPAGAALKESPLSREIGVSRTPVREALRRLVAEGLIENLPNQGCRLKTWTDEDLEEIFRLRVLMESHGARLAAQRITPPELQRLKQLADTMESLVADSDEPANLCPELSRLNDEFHQLILAATHSDRLRSLASQMISMPLVHRTFTVYRPNEIRRSMAHHRELTDAFAAHDPDWAESVMRAHLAAGYRAARRLLAD